MASDYERLEFWKSKIKVKIINCDNKESWYSDKIGKTYEIVSGSVRDYYIKEDDRIKSILVKDAEVIL